MIKTSFFTRLLACVLVFLSIGTFSVQAETDHATLQLLLDKVNQLRDDVRQMRNGQQSGSAPLVNDQFTQDVIARRPAFTGAFAILLTPGVEQQQAQSALNNLKEICNQLEDELKKIPASAPAAEHHDDPVAPAVEAQASVAEHQDDPAPAAERHEEATPAAMPTAQTPVQATEQVATQVPSAAQDPVEAPKPEATPAETPATIPTAEKSAETPAHVEAPAAAAA